MTEEIIKEFEQSNKFMDKKIQRNAIILSAMGAFLDGYDLLIIGVVLLTLIPQWNLSLAATGILTASSFLGMIIGGVVFGVVADKIGRRAVFILDMIIFIFGAIACGLAQNIVELIVFRFFIGMAIGMDSPTSTSIIVEFSDRKHRGRNATLMQIFWPFGSVIASCVALLLYFYAGVHAWRWMFASGVIPAVIVLFLRRKLPETPYWTKNIEEKEDDNPRPIKENKSRKKLKAGSIKDLLHRPWLKSIFFVSTFWFLTNLSSGLFLFMPYIAKKSFGLVDAGAIAFAAIVTLIQVIVLAILAVKVIDQSGRRPMSLIGMALTTLAALVLAFISGHTILMTIVFCIMMVSLMSPGQGPYWVWSVELFPTRLRATGAGVATALGKIGSLVATLLFPIYLAHTGWKITLLTYFVIFLLATILVALYAPETKGTSLSRLDQMDREKREAITW
jgi:putative MFS transporter